MNSYLVKNLNDDSPARVISADGFYVEQDTNAVCLYTGDKADGNLVARLFNVSIELVPAA